MPANFPEVWRARVETNLRATDQAPFLDGIEEIDTTILEVGSGAASEQNVIHLPVSEFEVDVLINNTAYPLALQAYTDTTATIQLDKYQTKVITLGDDQVIGAAYPRIDAATRTLTQGILKSKYGKAIHAIAPAAHSADTPIIATTGAIVGGGATGRRRLIYDDLVRLKDLYDQLEVPMTDRRLVLCSDHWNDLLLDRERFGDNFSNYRTGNMSPMVAGFEIQQYIANPYFTAAGAKKAYGAVPVAGEFQASVGFYKPIIAKKTGFTKQYFAGSTNDPENQTNKYAIRHYFIAVPKRQKYIGGIYSAYVA